MISVSAGRDYTSYNRYEFVVFDDENVVARQGGFSNNTAAKKAGVKVAQEYAAKAA